MLQPKKTKFRRQQKGRMKGNAQRGNQLAFGSFGIKALQNKWITGRQIEAARIAVTRYMQRQGQIWIRIFPDKPITKKPAEVRMGKGKGSPEGFVAPITPGRIIIEVEGVSYEIAKEALSFNWKEIFASCSYNDDNNNATERNHRNAEVLINSPLSLENAIKFYFRNKDDYNQACKILGKDARFEYAPSYFYLK